MTLRIYNTPLKPAQVREFRAAQEQGYYLADTESSTHWPVRDVFDEWCREQGRAAVVGIAHCPRNYSSVRISNLDRLDPVRVEALWNYAIDEGADRSNRWLKGGIFSRLEDMLGISGVPRVHVGQFIREALHILGCPYSPLLLPDSEGGEKVAHVLGLADLYNI